VKVPVILFVVECEEPVHRCLSRALMMARYLKVPLQITLCGLRAAGASDSAAASHVAEEAREYLQALRKSIIAPDVEITTEIARAGPLAEVIAGRAREGGAALIIKPPSLGHMLGRNRTDWQLMQSCPSPLLLTEGRSWHPQAQFAAAVDVMDPNQTKCRAIIAAAAALRLACAAELDLIYAQPENSRNQASEGESPAQLRLTQLGREFDIEPQHLHLLSGSAKEMLRDFVTEKQYDLLVIGAPQRSGTLFSRARESPLALSMAAIGCDLLIVNHRETGTDSALRARPRFRWDGTPWWQWIGAD